MGNHPGPPRRIDMINSQDFDLQLPHGGRQNVFPLAHPVWSSGWMLKRVLISCCQFCALPEEFLVSTGAIVRGWCERKTYCLGEPINMSCCGWRNPECDMPSGIAY